MDKLNYVGIIPKDYTLNQGLLMIIMENMREILKIVQLNIVVRLGIYFMLPR